jgi:hypothetical protein
MKKYGGKKYLVVSHPSGRSIYPTRGYSTALTTTQQSAYHSDERIKSYRQRKQYIWTLLLIFGKGDKITQYTKPYS